MRDGEIKSIDVLCGTVMLNSDTKEVSVPFDRVFRATGTARSRTPDVNFWWSFTRVTLSPTTVAFLEQAARVIGERERRQSQTENILRTLVGYVRSRLAPEAAIALDPPRSLDQIILKRKAACLQFALIGGLILAEAGYDVSIVTYHPAVGAGHAWLEVTLTDQAGINVAYIVDMSWDHPVVATIGHISRSIRGGSSTYKYWYTNADRKYFEL